MDVVSFFLVISVLHLCKYLTYSLSISQQSAKQFIQDLEMLDAYQESTTSSASLPAPLTLFRLSGLEQIVQQHGQHSPQYRSAISTLKKFLDGILSTSTKSQTILIAVPPKPAHTRLRKRTSLSLLAPFQTS